MSNETPVIRQRPSILLVDDSEHYRSYLHREFAQAGWSVHVWKPEENTLQSVELVPCHLLIAALAKWYLGPQCPYTGLEVLNAVRAKNGRTVCLLYALHAGEEEWRLAVADAKKAGICVIEQRRTLPQDIARDKVEKAVEQRYPGFQTGQEGDAWIKPELDRDQRSAQTVAAVGKRHLVSIVSQLFFERGPDQPIQYKYLRPGYSGARVLLLEDPPGSRHSGPRYILKLAEGHKGWDDLQRERRVFQRLVSGADRQHDKLKEYLSDELLPAPEQPDPACSGDWHGIAFRAVGHAGERPFSFGEIYTGTVKGRPEAERIRQLDRFLEHLYLHCLGAWSHRAAKTVDRRLWGEGEESGACYHLTADKRHAIFAGLGELEKRAASLLKLDGQGGAARQLILEVSAFIKDGQCGPLDEPTLFDRSFSVLSSGTHGDLHSGNILGVDREGETFPFIIDFSEFEANGHPLCDYARLENDIRMRLMNSEDGSDIRAELLSAWIEQEKTLHALLENPRRPSEFAGVAQSSEGLIQKGYWLMAKIRWLAYQNLVVNLRDQSARPRQPSFCLQYMSALLHRTLISLASTDILYEKKALGLWLAARLISEIGEVAKEAT